MFGFVFNLEFDYTNIQIKIFTYTNKCKSKNNYPDLHRFKF